MKAKTMVFELKAQIKEKFCNILVDRYKELHNGELPNWENDEEIVLTENDIDENDVNYIYINENNTYDDYYNVARYAINRYFVTLDYNLIFEDENENEYDWSEISIDDLAKLLDYLTEKFD